MRTTVVDIDLVAYSDLVRVLEESQGVGAVAQLNSELQESIRNAAADAGLTLDSNNYKDTGDGALLFFSVAEQAVKFGRAMHEAAAKRNESRTTFQGKRFFRVGAATGDVEFGSDGKFAGLTIALAVRLQTAGTAGTIVLDDATFSALPADLQKQCGPAEEFSGKRKEVITGHRCVIDPTAGDQVAEYLGATKVSKPPRPPDRTELLKIVNALSAGDVARLIYLLDIPIDDQPSKYLSLAEQKIAVLQWTALSPDREQRLIDMLPVLTSKP